MQISAKKAIEQKLTEKGVTVFPDKGYGRFIKNDRSNYIWLVAEYSEKTFWISMFYNDFDTDTDTGNFHTQIGRLRFSKPASDKGCGSSNVVKDGMLDIARTIADHKDPMELVKNYTKDDCLNRKWVTVDDILQNDNACEAIAEAFIRYMKEDTE